MIRKVASTFLSVALSASPLLAQANRSPAEPINSPRIARLHALVEGGDTTAEPAFWLEITGHAPLLELIPPRNEGDGWATFVWRGNDSTTAVTVDATFPPLYGARWAAGARALTHLAGTQLWYRTERLPFDFRLSYQFHVTTKHQGGVLETVDVADPRNSNTPLGDMSVAEGLLAPKQPWFSRRAGVPAGVLRKDSIFSRELGQNRTVTVYTPAGSHGGSTSLVVMLDGERYASELSMPETLDNLIAAGMIKPAIVVFVNARQPYNRQDDYSCTTKFSNFIVDELVPWTRRTYHASASAGESVIGGSSQGGLQAACTAYWHPEVFGNVLSLSGSYFYYRGWPAYEQSLSTQTGWLTQEVATHARRPLRFFVSTGTFEGDGVPETRRFRDVLAARGYPCTYLEFSGGHDEVIWRGVVANGLIALLSPRAPTPAK